MTKSEICGNIASTTSQLLSQWADQTLESGVFNQVLQKYSGSGARPTKHPQIKIILTFYDVHQKS